MLRPYSVPTATGGVCMQQTSSSVYNALSSVDDLPMGWTEGQDGGTYRLTRRADKALFGYAVGPRSWKKFLHPPQLRWGSVRKRCVQ